MRDIHGLTSVHITPASKNVYALRPLLSLDHEALDEGHVHPKFLLLIYPLLAATIGKSKETCFEWASQPSNPPTPLRLHSLLDYISPTIRHENLQIFLHRVLFTIFDAAAHVLKTHRGTPMLCTVHASPDGH